MSNWNEMFQYTLVLVAIFRIGWMVAKTIFENKKK